MSLFKGSGVAIATPFNWDDTIDFDLLEKHIKFLEENNTDAIIACGTTGESATLSDDEKLKIITFIREKTNSKIPVIAGAGSNNTKHCIELCQIAKKAGANATLIVSPYYNKTTQSGLIEHYNIISESTDLPIILYNIPSRTGINMEPKTIQKLSEKQNIIGIKESSSNISAIAEIANLCGKNLDIYAGNDNEILPILSLGGKGAISTVANIAPKSVHDLIYNFFEGNIEESKKIQFNMLNLINSLFCEVNPIPVKEALTLMGLNKGYLRAPLVKISYENKQKLITDMQKYGLIS